MSELGMLVMVMFGVIALVMSVLSMAGVIDLSVNESAIASVASSQTDYCRQDDEIETAFIDDFDSGLINDFGAFDGGFGQFDICEL